MTRDELNANEKIRTLHPQRKSGVNISKAKYETVKQAIVDALRREGTLTFTDLTTAVGEKLNDRFDGSIGWYVTTVKLDLEARDIIERVPKSSPQQLHLKN